MSAFSSALNFEYTIAPPSDGGLWGEMTSPGVFTGIVGELQKEYADVIWANLFVVPDRFKYIDYTDPYATDYVCYMVGEYFLSMYIIRIPIKMIACSNYNTIFFIFYYSRSKFHHHFRNGWR